MSKVTTDSANYTAIAEALRAKTGGTKQYKPGEMAQGISAIVTGKEMNYTIINSQAQPENPQENTIWVKSKKTVPTVYIQWDEPTSPADGTLWITQGTQSHTPISIISGENVIIYPLEAKQYLTSTKKWVKLTSMTYKNGAWVDWNVHLYDSGNDNSVFTGGWSMNARALNATMQGIAATLMMDEDSMYVSGTSVLSSAGSGTTLLTNKAMDFTDYSTLNVEFSSVSGTAYLCLAETLADYPDTSAGVQLANASTTATQTASLDISGISGARYVMCPIYVYYTGTTTTPLTLRIHKMWLE